MALRQGFNSLIEGSSGATGPTVASAPTLNLTANTQKVTGTAAISKIVVPATFVGTLTLIAEGAWSLVVGGNISQNLTAIVGQSITLTLAGSTWYPSAGGKAAIPFTAAVTFPGATIDETGGWIDVENDLPTPMSQVDFITSAVSYSGTFDLEFFWYSNGILDIASFSALGPTVNTGYVWRFNNLSGAKECQILRMDAGVLTDITNNNLSGSQLTHMPGNLSADLVAGWHQCSIVYDADGNMSVHLDGKLMATADDNTYAAGGPIGYGRECPTDTEVDAITITTSVDDQPMPDPTSVVVGFTNKSDLRISWAFPLPKPKGFDEFQIRYNTTNVYAGSTYLDSTKRLQLLVTDPLNDPPLFVSATTYYFFVAAVNKAGYADNSPPSASITMPTVPDVTGLAATITKKGDVELTWSPVNFKGFAGYRISAGATLAGATFIGHSKKPQWTVTDPAVGSTTYWVQVEDRSGVVDSSPPSVVATVVAPPDVTGLTATITTKDDIKLSWTKPTILPAAFNSYEIRIGASWAGVALSSITETGTTATGTTATAHGYAVGSSAVIVGASVAGYDGTYTVLTVPSSTTFTFKAAAGLGSATGGSAGTLVDRTKKTNYLIVDPPNGTDTYWVGVLDNAGNYDTTPPSVTISYNQQPYTVKTLLGADVGPFNSQTTIIGPFNYVTPPTTGRLHVDWTMIFTNGSTAQALRGMVQDNTTPLNCAQHRTHMDSGGVGGLNASGHFDRLYPGGSTISLSLLAIPVGGNNVTINASDEEGGGTGNASVTFLDVQFHPSPN